MTAFAKRATLERPLPALSRSMSIALPSPDLVVSRHLDGSAASRYGDVVWDLSAYHPVGRSARINLGSWAKSIAPSEAVDIIIDEIRWLMHIVMVLRHGPTLSLGSLRGYLRLFNALAGFSFKNARTLIEVLSNPALLRGYIADCAGHNSPVLRSFLNLLIELGPEKIGFKPLSGAIYDAVDRVANAYTEKQNQHPPIPTRIYTALIANLLWEMQAFDAIANQYFDLVEDCRHDPLLGRSHNRRRRILRDRGQAAPDTPPESFKTLLELRGLAEYFRACDLVLTVQGMNKGLTDLQLVCKLTIQVFSGMRDQEANTLTYACIEKSTVRGRESFRIQGQTTKLNHGQAKSAHWVTSGDGVRAIHLAQSIARVIYRAAGIQEDPTGADYADLPLFPSASYLGFSGVMPRTAHGRVAISHLDTFNMKELYGRLLPLIEDADLAELENVDPHRPWRSEDKFLVGEAWPLTSHQVRRSLALYASRSGLVTLPSLRRQLQHITEEMSRYYAAGSAYAQDLLGSTKDHFGLEWQRTQPEAHALAYLRDVLLADERLFGGHGTWIETHGQRGQVLTLADREQTIKRFHKGEMAYQETPLGSCTAVEVCDRRPLRSVVACIDCARTVIKPSKLKTVIRAQSNLVSQLDPLSVEGRAENEDLQALIELQRKLDLKLSQAGT